MNRHPIRRTSRAAVRAVLSALVAGMLSLIGAQAALAADESDTNMTVTVPAVQSGHGVDPPTQPAADPAPMPLPPTGLPSWVAVLGWAGAGMVGAGTLTLVLSRTRDVSAGIIRGTATRKVLR